MFEVNVGERLFRVINLDIYSLGGFFFLYYRISLLYKCKIFVVFFYNVFFCNGCFFYM